MAGSVKVSGTWRALVRPFVRVSGTWRNVTQAWVKVGGSWVLWFVALITDSFNRANTVTGLGTTDTGQSWLATRGNWFVSSNQARSDDTASNYPLASVEFGGQDGVTSLSVTPGVGPAFWVTDSGSWWASYAYTQSSTTTNCNGPATGNIYSSPITCVCGSQTSGSSSNCGGPATGLIYISQESCTCGSSYSGPVQDCYPLSESPYCTDIGGTIVGNQCCFTVTRYGCTATLQNVTLYGCSATQQSVTTTSHALRVVKSESNTVSTVGSDVTLASFPAAISVTTSGNTITSRAWSSANLTGLLGTNTQTPSSPVRGTKVGLVKAPSPSSQGSTADTFSAGA